VSLDPLKRGVRFDLSGEVVLVQSLDAPSPSGDFENSYHLLDRQQFSRWQEEIRNGDPVSTSSTDSTVCDLAFNALRVCVSRRIPQGYAWRFEVNEERSRVVVTTPAGVEVPFSDGSFGLLLFRLESTNWSAVKPPEPLPPSPPPPAPEEARKIDAFDRARAEILAKRLGVAQV
jgi:hypothetical protein